MSRARTSRYRRTYGVAGQLATDIIGCGCPIAGSGFVSCDIYANSTLLEAAYPAPANSASFGLVLSSSLPVTYQSNGTNWLLISEAGGGGSLSLSTQVVITSLTASTNNVLLVDASGGDLTIGLPDAASSTSTFYHIKKTDSTFNTISIDASGSQTVDGSVAMVEVDFPNSIIQVVNNGVDSWFII